MKIFLVNTLLLVWASSVLSQNILSINNTLSSPENNFWVEVKLNNVSDIIGFQFDMDFPDEITYLDSFQLGSRFTDHQVILNSINNNVIRVLCFSMTNSVIADSTGMLLRLLFKAGRLSGEFPITLSNVTLVSINGTNVLDSVRNGVITIQNPDDVRSEKIPKKLNNEKKFDAYPNPFNNSTKISYFSNTLQPLRLTIISIDGKVLREKRIIPRNIGRNEELINMTSFASGMYILKLKSMQNISVAKILLIK